MNARLAAAAAAALACSLALAGCGSKQDVLSASGRKPFTVMLDWFPNADHAPLYAALAHGDFSAVGLDVKPVVPAETAEPLKLLAADRVDMAISYEPELLLARDQGLKLVSIGALVQEPLTSIIALSNKHVASVGDLKGKTVGTAGIPYQTAMLRTALTGVRVNPASVKEVNVGFNLVPAMLSGKVDATLGGYWNYEAIQLHLAHRAATVIPVNHVGVPTYNELVLVVREQDARRLGPDLRGFMQALAEGEHAVRENPAAAAALVEHANPSLDAKLQLESIRQTLPAATPAHPGEPFGWQEPAAWSAFASWMYAHGLIGHAPGEELPPFTNEYLPGQGI